MKKALYLFPIGILFLCTSVRAQKANIDSLELVAQISQDQLKLGKLLNMVDQKTTNKQTAVVNAQNSASDNVRAAQNLNDDPNNKKLASDANSKAGDAKDDSKKARKESQRLDDLNKNIMELKNKIAVAQARLKIYSPAPALTPMNIPVSQPDSSQHP
jgi:hypothetical protein